MTQINPPIDARAVRADGARRQQRAGLLIFGECGRCVEREVERFRADTLEPPSPFGGATAAQRFARSSGRMRAIEDLPVEPDNDHPAKPDSIEAR